jgi:hypothetical protein
MEPHGNNKIRRAVMTIAAFLLFVAIILILFGFVLGAITAKKNE